MRPPQWIITLLWNIGWELKMNHWPAEWDVFEEEWESTRGMTYHWGNRRRCISAVGVRLEAFLARRHWS